jgi:C_GCAxxG_C_C family probable redox protein
LEGYYNKYRLQGLLFLKEGSLEESIKKKIVADAVARMDENYHCSEAILLAAAGHYLPDLEPLAVRLSTPFAGGVGCSKMELCGALAGGLLVIGALYGREDAQTNDDLCQALALQWRERFLQTFGDIACQDLRENWVGQPGQPDCKALVGQTASLLVDFLEKNVS